MAEVQADDEGGTLIARKVGEAVQNTLGAVVTAIDIPLGEPGQCLSWCNAGRMRGSGCPRCHFTCLLTGIEFGSKE